VQQDDADQIDSSAKPVIESSLDYFNLTGNLAQLDEEEKEKEIKNSDDQLNLNEEEFVYAQFSTGMTSQKYHTVLGTDPEE